MFVNRLGYSGSSYLNSIRRQAEKIADRVESESKARLKKQEETGLIQNPATGEYVELSSVPEWKQEVWEERTQANSVSPSEALIGFMATAPNSDDVERSKALAAIASKIQNKMLSGKKISGEEKNFLREHYPDLAALAARMESEAQQLEAKLRHCKSSKEASQMYMEAKAQLLSSVNKKDGAVLFLMAAIDEAYKNFEEKGNSSKTTINILT